MSFSGAEGFSENIRLHIQSIYDKIKETRRSARPKEVGNQITLMDIILISMMVNRHNKLVPKTAGRSPYFHLNEVAQLMDGLVQDLEENNKVLKANRNSKLGTLEADEEIIMRAAGILLKMFYVSGEQTHITTTFIPDRPYGFSHLVEASMDKAKIEIMARKKQQPTEEGE